MDAQPTTQAQRLAASTSVPLESPYGIEFSLDPTDDGSGVPDSYEGVIALDPDVLASLVIQLRTNLQATQTEFSHVKDEREELITALAIAQTKISDLKFEKEDMRKAMTDLKGLNERERLRAEGLQKDLGEALHKVQEGEEAIAMLRSKVEESRRGLMRLQSEQSRRISQLAASSPMPMIASPFATSTTFDGLPRTPVPGTAGFAKRLSTPGGLSVYAGQSLLLAPPPKGRNGHKRHSSSSEPDTSTTENSLSLQQERAAHRQSMFVRPTESLLNPLGAELEALRQELVAARMELDGAQALLKEEQVAREAGELCVKALKEFIAENAIGDPSSSADGNSSIRGMSLPPLPTENNIPDTPSPPPQPVPRKGWVLAALWGSGSSASASETTPKAKPPPVSQPSTAFGRWRSGSNTSTSTTQTNNTNSTGQAQGGEDNYTPAPTRSSAGRRAVLFGSISSIGSVSLTGRSPPRSTGRMSCTPSLEDSRESMSGTSSEGPDSPDPKPTAALERVDIVQVPEIHELGLVSLDTGVNTDKKSGEVTPTGGGGRVHADSVAIVA